MLDVVRRTAEACFMPLTVGGGVRTIDDIRKLLLAGADKASINSAAVARPRIRQGRRRRNSATSASSSPSTPRRVSRAGRGEPLGNLHPWRPQADRHRRGRLCARGGRARRGRNPAHLDGSRRHRAGLRHRADARRRGCGPDPGHRLGRRRQSRSSGRRRHATATRAPCSPPRSSISANSRSGEAKARMAEAGIPVRMD